MCYTNNENLEYCKACGGQCCTVMPCAFHPDDFKELDESSVKKLLNQGLVCLQKISTDIYIGDDMKYVYAYILRPKAEGNLKAKQTPKFGKCMFLTDKGCMLIFRWRPSEGRHLIPMKNNKDCYIDDEKYEFENILKAWYFRYHDLLSEIWYYGKLSGSANKFIPNRDKLKYLKSLMDRPNDMKVIKESDE